VRLLIYAEKDARNYCIITLFLNCALRLSELVSIDVSQIEGDILTIVGKGDRMRKVYLTPSARKSVNEWLTDYVAAIRHSEAVRLDTCGGEIGHARRQDWTLTA